MAVSIHPSVDNGVKPGSPNFAGGTLQCQCASNPVEVTLTSQTAHNHVCGCTKCWKPAGSLFSISRVAHAINVSKNADRLKVVRRQRGDQRMPARTVHMAAENTKHPFHGSIFHTELSRTRAGRRPIRRLQSPRSSGPAARQMAGECSG